MEAIVDEFGLERLAKKQPSRKSFFTGFEAPVYLKEKV
jgi:hypothetical protein